MTAPAASSRRRLLLAAPAGVVALAGLGFWGMLRGMSDGSFDPHSLNNPLLGKAIPPFTLSAQAPGEGFGARALRAASTPVLINFFASWCIPCVQEAPALSALRTSLPIWGIAYKDRADEAAEFVAQTGDPYARVGRDGDGRVAIDWGVYGVPESFLVHRGTVRWHYAGPLNGRAVQDALDLAARLG